MISTIEELTESSLNKGAAYTIKIIKNRPEFGSGKIPFSEDELNQLGYQLLYDLNRIDDAIEIFRFTTEAYPQSANTFDSLGEAYFVRGRMDKATINYKRSLELNPGNKNAVHMLRQLRSHH